MIKIQAMIIILFAIIVITKADVKENLNINNYDYKKNNFDQTAKDHFIKSLNSFRFLLGASDMIGMNWTEKDNEYTVKKVKTCNFTTVTSNSLAYHVTTINDIKTKSNDPDLSLVLIDWINAGVRYNNEKFSCLQNDLYCYAYANLIFAMSETVTCSYQICQDGIKGFQKYNEKTKKLEDYEIKNQKEKAVVTVCYFNEIGYREGNAGFTKGRKCDDCSQLCINDLLCGPWPKIRGWRGWHYYS